MKGFIIKSEKLDHGFKLYHVKHWDSNLLIYRIIFREINSNIVTIPINFDLLCKFTIPSNTINDICHALRFIFRELKDEYNLLDLSIVNVTDRPQDIALLNANGIIVPTNAWELLEDINCRIMISGISPNDIPINFLFLVKEKIRFGILKQIL